MTGFSQRLARDEPGLLARLFEASAESAGARLALVDQGSRVTFEELSKRVEQIAAGLAAVSPSAPVVGVNLLPSIDAVALILAVARLGGTYVPLDPEHPRARKQAILAAAKPDLVVGDEQHDEVPSRRCVDLMSSGGSSPTDVIHDPTLNIVFTSGSTGRPKGVRILKDSLVNRLAWMDEVFPFEESDVVLLHKPLALVAAAVEVFQGLIAGIPTVIAPRSVVRDPPALWDLLRRESVSHVLASPAFWSGLVEHAETSGETLPALRFATTSAEPISPDLARRWLRCFPSVPFWNLYGSTECSSNAAAFDIRELRDSDRVVPIGRPIRNVRTTIRDKHLQPVRRGAAGELCVSGACLSAGYLDDELSRQWFCRDPDTGDRLLRTGDLAYERDDGNLVLVGREDNRVNVNGYRVELEEVERALEMHSKVTACAVALAPEPANGLVGYIVGDKWKPAEMRAHLGELLPSYMVPRYWVSLSRLPRNAAGKLARSSLPPPSLDRQDLGISLRPPSTPLEELVVQLWSELLGFTEAGMDDDFHAYGGSSVQAAAILGRLRGVMRIRIPFEEFMAEATPAGLARSICRRLDESLASDIAQAWSAMQTAEDRDAAAHYASLLAKAGLDVPLDLPAPTNALSFGQNSLWFFQQLRPESPAYNLTYAYRLRGPLRIDALRAALNDLVAANESLRSAFVEERGQPTVTVADSDACSVDVTTSTLTEEEIKAFVDGRASRSFNLHKAPLLRASIGSLGPDDNVLVIDVHHIVFDGWSRRILLDQVAENYRRRVQGDDEPVHARGVSYRTFSELQRQWMNSNEASAALAFWRQRLDGIEAPLPLPTDGPRPESHPHTGRKVMQRLGGSLSGQIDAFAREMHSTPFVALLAGFKLLLKSKQIADLVVGVPFANRERPEFESTIGYFVNMVVVRTRYEDSVSGRELLTTETDAVNEAVSHGSYPFDRLVADLSVSRSLAHTPLFQVIFNLLGDEWDTLSLEGIDAEALCPDNGGSQVDLNVAARRSADGYTLTWEYCDALFSEDTIAAWQIEFRELLNELTAHPELSVSSILGHARDSANRHMKETSEAMRSARIERLRQVRSSPGDAAGSPPKILRGRRRQVSSTALTREERMFDDLAMVKIEPAVRGLDPIAWASDQAPALQNKLIQCGGLLLRGFELRSGDDFERFFRAVCGQLNEYTHRVTKRTQAGNSFVYTSTDHPKTLDLALHNETSYTRQWPARIGFYCDVPSREGGQTPIADSRKVLAALPRDLVARFARNQLLYMRNSGNAIELTWQETFQTEDKAEVEQYCKSHDMAFEWKANGQLRTFQRCHVMARHPVAKEVVWFNQAHMMHRSAYPPGVIERMFPSTPDDELPFNVFFGDKTPIQDADIALINATYQNQARSFDWQRGDVMILDNMLMAHGRRPFDGERRILVAMSGTITESESALAPGRLE